MSETSANDFVDSQTSGPAFDRAAQIYAKAYDFEDEEYDPTSYEGYESYEELVARLNAAQHDDDDDIVPARGSVANPIMIHSALSDDDDDDIMITGSRSVRGVGGADTPQHWITVGKDRFEDRNQRTIDVKIQARPISEEGNDKITRWEFRYASRRGTSIVAATPCPTSFSNNITGNGRRGAYWTGTDNCLARTSNNGGPKTSRARAREALAMWKEIYPDTPFDSH